MHRNNQFLPLLASTRSRFGFAAAVVGTILLARLMPHTPNVSPLSTLALLSGACLTGVWMAIALPIVAMFASDLVLGFHPMMPAIYLAVALTVLMGQGLAKKPTGLRVAASCLGSSVLFFVLTNFAVWMVWYPPTAAGLAGCFTAAVPFFQNSLLGNAFFTALVFGGLALPSLVARQRTWVQSA